MFENINIPQVMRWVEIITQQLYYWLLFALLFAAVIVLPKYIIAIVRYIFRRLAAYVYIVCLALRGGGSVKLLRAPFASAFSAAPDILISDGESGAGIRIVFADDIFAFRSVVTVKGGDYFIITSVTSKSARKAAEEGEVYAVTGSEAQGQGDDRRRKIRIKPEKDCADLLLVSPKPLALCLHRGNRIEPFYRPAKAGGLTVCSWSMFRELMK